MELAKPAVDVGLYTNDLDAMLAFWQEQAHTPFTELLKIGGGQHQHRHAIGDSVLKVNHRREPVTTSSPSGLRQLEIFSDQVDETVEMLDPDGNELLLSPTRDDERNLCLHMTTNDLHQARHFYGKVLGLPETAEHTFEVGASLIHFTQGSVAPIERTALGYRYMTFQVFDVLGTHQGILKAGGTQGMAPVRLGDVAYISFVRDPDGNWLEISQRKSITGSLE